MINNLLVILMKNVQKEPFLQIRNLQNIYSSREYPVYDEIASICEIGYLKQKQGITGILFGQSGGRIMQYNVSNYN